jgi:hypothetical protein
MVVFVEEQIMNRERGIKETRWPLAVGIIFLLLIVLVELVTILTYNSGHLVFTLDDPYIHLALAENIMEGHYGINTEEFSAASSSILWPFLLAPFAGSPFGVYFIFLLNCLAAIGSLYFFWKILCYLFPKTDMEPVERNWLIGILLVLFIPAINLVGLILTGMEHSIQVFLVVLTMWGLLFEMRENRVPMWLLLVIIVSPLIRYENLAVSFPALIYLFIRGHRAKSLIAAGIIVAIMGAFSLFLVNLGLEPLPNSILAKSSVMSSHGRIGSILANFQTNRKNPRGALLIIAVAFFISQALKRKVISRDKLFALVIAAGIIAHIFVGRNGWYNRYEIYIWTVSMIGALFFLRKHIADVCLKNGIPRFAIASFIWVLAISSPYFMGIVTAPVASANIYEQQYQMHRFATDYYEGRVAVNDIGYVSYRNDNYVLDLWGLASVDALDNLQSGGYSSESLGEIVLENNVGLIMIYEESFQQIPDNWVKIGDLHLGKKSITAMSIVAFFAVDNNTYIETIEVVREFAKTLPKGVVFEFAEIVT